MSQITLAFFVLLASFSVQARDFDESRLLLQEAMMESNADYNKHKKKTNYEEFERADDWTERDTQVITLGGGTPDWGDFQQLKDHFQIRETELTANEPKNKGFDNSN